MPSPGGKHGEAMPASDSAQKHPGSLLAQPPDLSNRAASFLAGSFVGPGARADSQVHTAQALAMDGTSPFMEVPVTQTYPINPS